MEVQENNQIRNLNIIYNNDGLNTYSVTIDYIDKEMNILQFRATQVELEPDFIEVYNKDKPYGELWHQPCSSSRYILKFAAEGRIIPSKKDVAYTVTVTDITPRKEMTTKEIEKILGYKIKIKA